MFFPTVGLTSEAEYRQLKISECLCEGKNDAYCHLLHFDDQVILHLIPLRVSRKILTPSDLYTVNSKNTAGVNSVNTYYVQLFIYSYLLCHFKLNSCKYLRMLDAIMFVTTVLPVYQSDPINFDRINGSNSKTVISTGYITLSIHNTRIRF